MWRPGNLVTINGIVYRVKRAESFSKTCKQCALNDGLLCLFPIWMYGSYSLPEDCYLERVSPIIKIIQ